MKELSSLVFLYTETPLHAGSGTALGAVDLPIQREKLSGLPMVQGSGIKGALRAELNRHNEAKPKEWQRLDKALFGREPPAQGESAEDERANDKAGALSLLDARLLLLPVRTVWGGFAWVTSPLILQRLARDLEVAKLPLPEWRSLQPTVDGAIIGTGCSVAKGESFLVEDLEYPAKPDRRVDELAEWLVDNALPRTDGYAPFRRRLAAQLAVVSDDELRFLSEHATEVVTRVRINPETGIVAEGALWTEESLPAETLLWSLAFFTAERPARKPEDKQEKAQKLRDTLSENLQAMTRIMLGGDRTVGRGIVGIRLSDGGAP